MDWLNYHHLHYFWSTVKAGSISAASRTLGVSQPTVSAQLRTLEKHVGGKLYELKNRQLVLTELGQTVYRYADVIFSIGNELIDVLNGRTASGLTKFTVGVPDVLPKLVSYRLLRPIFERDEEFQLVIREGSLKYLLTKLAAHELDVVFSDTPAGTLLSVKAFYHRLGQSEVAVYGSRKLVRKHGTDLPSSLVGAPMLVPREGTMLRQWLDQWLRSLPLLPRIVGEFDDTALMKVFAQADHGFVAAPTVIEADLKARFGLERLCLIPAATQEFFAISIERRLKHPGATAIADLARQQLFAEPGDG